MNRIGDQIFDDTTASEKLIAALSGFGFACFAFFFSAIVLLPLTGHLEERFAFPVSITATLVFVELFGLTSVAGIFGVVFAARGFAGRRNS